MTKVRVRSETIRRYIVDRVEKHPLDIAKLTADKFEVTRQAVNKHLQKLVDEQALTSEGNTRSKRYKLAALVHWRKTYKLSDKLEEDRVWREDVFLALGRLPQNVLDIWHYGFTEMFNNAIDHSEGGAINVVFQKTASTGVIAIHDDGVGIFKKIQTSLGLIDERHAVLEVSKGKVTTDPDRHSGERIFFASRMFDDFEILSGGVYFSHTFDSKEDWILERSRFKSGTSVWMKLNNHTSRTMKKVFDNFTSKEHYGFTKTVVPVKLVQYGGENLVSRSQAKRLLGRVDRFETVVLDFKEVDSIGQAFADEIFRVFVNMHPRISVSDINANPAVQRMIARARNARNENSTGQR